MNTAIFDHLETGTTTVCRTWAVERRDGAVLGFTDHDRDLAFDGVVFRANTGMTARALQQTTGLSVDNTEAVGALSDAAVTEADIMAGRFDGAVVRCWLVNWADPTMRAEQFRGTLGELVRSGGAFRAELRGLTEALNLPQGRVFHRGCSAVLGDGQCRFDLTALGYVLEAPVLAVDDRRVIRVEPRPDFDNRWFERGRLAVVSGAAAGLVGIIKNDRESAAGRIIELWQGIGADLRVGDTIRLEPGCDKRPDTCRLKFHNFLNFRGFPHTPGDDWLASYPVASQINDGGSLQTQDNAGTL